MYTCTPACVQMVPPGTRHQHCTSSLETFTCFEMCYSQNSPHDDRHDAPPSCSLLKFSVLQFIFYNHCDVIKVVSLVPSVPGTGWTHVFAPWRPRSAESLESQPGNKAQCCTLSHNQNHLGMFTLGDKTKFSRLSFSLTTLV